MRLTSSPRCGGCSEWAYHERRGRRNLAAWVRLPLPAARKPQAASSRVRSKALALLEEGMVARCAAIKADSERCRGEAMPGAEWCYFRHRDYREQRQRNASKDGERGSVGVVLVNSPPSRPSSPTSSSGCWARRARRL